MPLHKETWTTPELYKKEVSFAEKVVTRYKSYLKGTFGGVTVSKLDYETHTCEFESHWVPHSFGLVPHQSKELRKLL